MTSQQIRSLLAPPSPEISQQKTLLLLNSRFRSLQDLDDLDSTTERILALQDNLRSQLSKSHGRVYTLLSHTRSSAKEALDTAQELSSLQHSLTDELSFLSRELVSSMSDDGERSPTLLEDVETLHRNMKELENVKGYVQVIQHALRLSESVIQEARTLASTVSVSHAAIKEYKSLQDFVSTVSKSCLQVEDGTGQQSIQLVTFLETVKDRAWADMKGGLSKLLLTAAEKLRWPMPVDHISAPPEDRTAFETAFLNLLKFQHIGDSIRHKDTVEMEGLYPLQVLLQPISLRFKYHFEATRPTNRLDKPEWFFTHILNVAHEHRSFFDSVIQPLLSSTEYRDINAWREFTLLLLPLLSSKLSRAVPLLIPHPSLLAHTIYQALAFDAALVEEGFSVSGTSASGKNWNGDSWGGVSDVILGRKEWFEAWMEGERKFAEDQYHEIISAPDAWLITEDEGSEESESAERELRTTNSARRIKAMVEKITDRYSPLPHFSQRTRFLLAVQLPLLEYYHARIQSSLDAFETLSSVFVRAVPGALGLGGHSGGASGDGGVKVDGRRLTTGVEGAQRLCKALLSARFVEVAMEGWGEELFFLELWTEINHRASLRAHAEDHRSLPDPKTVAAEAPEDTIFEELVIKYRKLIDRAEDMIVQQVCGEIEGGLKAHFASILSPKPDSTQPGIALSQTLLGPIALLSSHLNFLRTTLSRTKLMTLYRRIASRLSEHILHREITYRGRHRITVSEGKTIAAECELWAETCHAALASSVSRNRVESPWLKLLQAGRLLGLERAEMMSLFEETFRVNGNELWEDCLLRLVGICEIGRQEVGVILRLREDCDR